MKVLGLYPWSSFWSMGPRSGANSFFLAPAAFARFGHEIHISMPAASGAPREENLEGILIHRFFGGISFDSNPQRPLPVRVLSRAGRYLLYLGIATYHGVMEGRRIRPDLIIGYGVHGAAAACLAGRILGVPNLTRLFGLQLHLYLRSRLKRPGAFMDFFALKAPASYVIIHNDGSEGDQAARRLGVPMERVRFWRDGLDTSLCRSTVNSAEMRARLSIPSDHVVLFCVGRLSDDKRMGRLLEILPDVLRGESKVTLMLVGDGPDRPVLEERARALGLGAHVRMVGAVSREELPDYLAVGDIFLGVSDRTNANLAPIEAMSCGKPVVALDTGGTRELVIPEVTGLLVAPEAWREGLASAVLRLVQSPVERARLGEAAREKVLREIPTIEERQRMEVDLAKRAVEEFRRSRKRG